ncbi:MAG: MoxR family ATPase [Pirellulaceae bacterium]|nr:MoxR family ATPase [Pirellulaceae bacterium]
MNSILQSTREFTFAEITEKAREMCGLLNRVLLGKEDVIDLVLACLLARGHILFDDLPGLGKTTLAKAIATAVGGKFGRIQCTPDLLPTDITGYNIYNQKTHEFDFVAGPVFADVLLADEVNRTTPRTQSALFEAMAERQVTIDAKTRLLSPEFFVIATQNPIESFGTYPLPEAQLDRFAMKLRIGLPSRETEIELLESHATKLGSSVEILPCLQPGELFAIQEQVSRVSLVTPIRAYLVDLASHIRNNPDVRLGISPRALLVWQRIAQAWAVLQGRDFVIPDDVRAVAGPTISVRLSGEFDDPQSIINQAFDAVPVPK